MLHKNNCTNPEWDTTGLAVAFPRDIWRVWWFQDNQMHLQKYYMQDMRGKCTTLLDAIFCPVWGTILSNKQGFTQIMTLQILCKVPVLQWESAVLLAAQPGIKRVADMKASRQDGCWSCPSLLIGCLCVAPSLSTNQ